MRPFVGRASVLAALVAVAALSPGERAAAQVVDVDPCADVVGQSAINACWAREAERSEDEVEGVYRALREKLPSKASSSLEKAQQLWREFRDAHVATLYGVENPFEVWGREYPMCVSISKYLMNRERTRELRRLLSPGPETVCPL